MKQIAGLLLTALFASACLAQPAFEDYPVDEVYDGFLATMRMNSHELAPQYADEANRQTDIGPNFAGVHTLFTFDCGANCDELVVMNTESGWMLAHFKTCGSHEFHLESRLLVINPDSERCETSYYLASAWAVEPLE